MKIQKIALCNFKNYKGEHSIDLSLNGNPKQNNIVLIGGVNGSGKTTLVECMKLCLFGKRFNGLTNKKYLEYIASSKNKSADEEGDDRFFVQVDLKLDDGYPAYPITLKREWHINDGKTTEEKFEILRDGNPLEIIPKEHWEDYIPSLIPSYVSDYFFFDGERVKELASGDQAEKILKESIRDLIGLKRYETLSNDLDALTTKIKRRNVSFSTINNQIKDKESEKLQMKKELKEIKRKIKKKSHRVEELIECRSTVEDDLRRKAGAFAEERKKNETAMSKLKIELDELNEKIKQICGDYLPFIIASKTCKNLLDQLEVERRGKELAASSRILRGSRQDFIDRVCSSEKLTSNFNDAQLGVIGSEIDVILSKMLGTVGTNQENTSIHNLSPGESSKIEDFIKKANKNIQSVFNNHLKRREEILIKLNVYRSESKKIPNERFIKEYIDEIASTNTEIKILKSEIESSKDKTVLLKDKEIKTEEEIRKLEEKIVCIEEDHRKVEICNNVKKSIQEFINTTISSKIGDLEKIITQMYHTLANKEDMVKQIKINPETFSTELVGFDGNIVDKDHMSVGEKEIYALSVLWGLAKISNRKIPMIIDSPLAKLDNIHVDKIIKNFFPNAADQVIILSHDREIDQVLYNTLEPYVNRAYRLSVSEVDKIEDGYFFGGGEVNAS